MAENPHTDAARIVSAVSVPVRRQPFHGMASLNVLPFPLSSLPAARASIGTGLTATGP